MKSPPPPLIDVVKLCCTALEEKKAGDLRVMHVGSLSSITDYLVIATATSEPHLRALRIELEKRLDEAGVRITGMDAAADSGWMVLDAFEVMVHLFTAERREQYGLEALWKDADEVAVTKLLAAGKPKDRIRAPKPRGGTRAAAAKARPKKPVPAKSTARKAVGRKGKGSGPGDAAIPPNGG